MQMLVMGVGHPIGLNIPRETTLQGQLLTCLPPDSSELHSAAEEWSAVGE